MYEKAVKAFRLVLVHPAEIVHEYMINSYKKYVIASLMIGKYPELPRKCDIELEDLSGRSCKDYMRLAEAFETVRTLIN